MAERSDFSLTASIGLVERIRSGYFRMGSPFHPRELPRKSVYVAEFELAHTHVTVNQYAVFVNSGQVEEQRWWSEAGWEWLQCRACGWGREMRIKPDRWMIQLRQPFNPVTGVTKYEAEAYCAWLSHHKRQAVRLPTESEWEYAARGDDNRPFPWGDEFEPTLTNTLERESGAVVEAASTPGDVSPFGVFDMAGNAQEWTSSPYRALEGEVFADAELFVVRGGSYNDTAFGARTSYRRAYPAGYFYPYLGFRVAVGHR